MAATAVQGPPADSISESNKPRGEDGPALSLRERIRGTPYAFTFLSLISSWNGVNYEDSCESNNLVNVPDAFPVIGFMK